jgi:hypothetical protein
MRTYRSDLRRACLIGLLARLVVIGAHTAFAYPPAVNILGPARNCLSCRSSDGQWKDPAGLIIDILDKTSEKSLRQGDAKKGMARNYFERRVRLKVE